MTMTTAGNTDPSDAIPSNWHAAKALAGCGIHTISALRALTPDERRAIPGISPVGWRILWGQVGTRLRYAGKGAPPGRSARFADFPPRAGQLPSSHAAAAVWSRSEWLILQEAVELVGISLGGFRQATANHRLPTKRLGHQVFVRRVAHKPRQPTERPSGPAPRPPTGPDARSPAPRHEPCHADRA